MVWTSWIIHVATLPHAFVVVHVSLKSAYFDIFKSLNVIKRRISCFRSMEEFVYLSSTFSKTHNIHTWALSCCLAPWGPVVRNAKQTDEYGNNHQPQLLKIYILSVNYSLLYFFLFFLFYVFIKSVYYFLHKFSLTRKLCLTFFPPILIY